MAPIVHHLGISQSERITFLCEELNIPYELKLWKRAPKLAPPEYKALHPQGTAPVIQDGDITLAESGACIEYLCHKHGNGRLFLKPDHPAYADFLYWWHWANGTFQPTSGRIMLARAGGLSDDHFLVKMVQERLAGSLKELDKRLQSNTWLAGDEFTAADVILVYSLTTSRYWTPYSLAGYDGILGYLRRIGDRPGYQRALKKSDPDMTPLLGAEPPKTSLLNS